MGEEWAAVRTNSLAVLAERLGFVCVWLHHRQMIYSPKRLFNPGLRAELRRVRPLPRDLRDCGATVGLDGRFARKFAMTRTSSAAHTHCSLSG